MDLNLLPPELWEIIISYTPCEWRQVNTLHKYIADKYLLLDCRFPLKKSNNSLINWACSQGYIELMKLLLDNERVYSTIDSNEILLHAFQFQKYESIKCLLDRLTIDKIDQRIMTYCLNHNYADGILILLKYKKIDPHIVINNLLEWAINSDNLDLVKLLLSYSPQSTNHIDIVKKEDHAFIAAIYKGNHEMIKLLLNDPRIDPSLHTNIAIRDACYYGRANIVKILLADSRVKPHKVNNYCIYVACLRNHTEVVKLLLQDERVNPTANCNECLYKSCKKGYIEVVKLLLADYRVKSYLENLDRYIEVANRKGHKHIVELLMS